MRTASARRFLHELRRRKVFRAAAVYAVVAWGFVQVTSVVAPALFLHPLVVTGVVVLAIVGFPVAMTLAWAFDITFSGIDRTEPLPAASATQAADPPPVPRPLTPLVGRERELDEVTSLLTTARLVTLTGPGGVGKTRLALELADQLAAGGARTVWFVELAALTDDALVDQAVAAAVRVREEAGRPHAETLGRHLSGQRGVLVLDNCEHVVGACARLAESLLRQCAALRILATSQEAFAVAGEARYVLRPLQVPVPSTRSTAASVAGSAAVRLFVERARSAVSGFALTDANADAVGRICRQLDGIPLALELAAARVRVLSAEEIASRLDDRFGLLAGGTRTALPRQQTLLALLDWSYDLLSADEQALLVRLSVFAGGFTLEAAESLRSGDHGGEVLDTLTGLVDKSLVMVDAATPIRYRLLETVRQYAAGHLAAATAAALRDALAAYFAQLVQRAAPMLEGPDEAPWLAVLEREHDNIRGAIARVIETGDAERALQLAGPLARFWRVRGHLAEGRRQLTALLDVAGGLPRRGAAAARALHGAGWLARDEGDYNAARTLFSQSLAAARAADDALGVAWALVGMGFLDRYEGRYAEARDVLLEAQQTAERAGLRVPLAAALGNLGLVARDLGDFGEARRLLERSLEVARSLGDRLGIAWALTNLGLIASFDHEPVAAHTLLEEALALWRALGDRQNIASALSNIGHIAIGEGDHVRAHRCLLESLELLREAGDRRGLAFVLERFVALAAARGKPHLALAVAAHAAALRESIGARQPPSLQAAYESLIEETQRGIPPEARRAAERTGSTLTLDDVVARLAELEPDGAPAGGAE
jgi:predicted ATPase